jgi:hypothetical protein
MQKFALLAAVIAASVALAAPSADAASKRSKDPYANRAPETSQRGRPNAVYGSDGRLIGVDPDPFIQLMMRRDPRPWDSPQ